jgi:hypothetical protein
MRTAPLLLALSLLGPVAANAGDPPGPVAPVPEVDEDVVRGYIGMSSSPVGFLTDEQKKTLGATKGVVVTKVVPGAPAEKAGLRAGDVLVQVNGKPVPDAEGLTDKSKQEDQEKYSKAWKALIGGVLPGNEVTLVVRRAGAEVTVKATAVDFDTYKQLADAASIEESYPRVPDPKEAGEPKAETFDFEKATDLPEGFLKFDGLWEARREQDATKPNDVLIQDSLADPWGLCLVTGPGRAIADGKVSVRFRPIEGREDASGGIAFRARDRKNYYLVRANALESNLRLYVLKDGSRMQIASVDVKPPEMGKWHTLEVSFSGTTLKATLDGKGSVSGTDSTFSTGWTGVWTKADSVTEFDDLKIEPVTPPAK